MLKTLEEISLVISSFSFASDLWAEAGTAAAIAAATEAAIQASNSFIISFCLSLTFISAVTNSDSSLQRVSLKVTLAYSNVIVDDICRCICGGIDDGT